MTLDGVEIKEGEVFNGAFCDGCGKFHHLSKLIGKDIAWGKPVMRLYYCRRCNARQPRLLSEDGKSHSERGPEEASKVLEESN